jgi:hypothetical protein
MWEWWARARRVAGKPELVASYKLLAVATVDATAQTLFELPDQWERLIDALGDLNRTPAFESVLRAMRDRATLATIELEYVDVDFRDEYVNHYATTYRPLPNRCRRLHFFAKDTGDGEKDRYLGYCVLRPLRMRPVGRTVIAPPDELRQYVACRCTSTVRPRGQRLSVEGFPFMEQDSQLGVCAHASVWMVALYHHLTNHTPRRVISDVATGAASFPEVYRVTPSEGMSEMQLAIALRQLELPAIPYAIDKLPPRESVSKIVCRYLNGHLPVVLATSTHATVIIGYGRNHSGRLFYISSDEGEGPYNVIFDTADARADWKLLLVPMPGRVYISGEVAESRARLIFEGLLRQQRHRALCRRLAGGLRLRSYVTQAGDYKVRMTPQRGVAASVCEELRPVGTSKWIWVTELQDPEIAKGSRECVLGEIVLDATTDELDINPLFAYVLGDSYVWRDADERPDSEPRGYTGPYLSGTAVHDAPSGRLPEPEPEPGREHGQVAEDAIGTQLVRRPPPGAISVVEKMRRRFGVGKRD